MFRNVAFNYYQFSFKNMDANVLIVNLLIFVLNLPILAGEFFLWYNLQLQINSVVVAMNVSTGKILSLHSMME